jgi:hypothetical protein
LSVFCNSDTPVVLDLEDLAGLSQLEVLELAKQRAYFPESRSFQARAGQGAPARRSWAHLAGPLIVSGLRLGSSAWP